MSKHSAVICIASIVIESNSSIRQHVSLVAMYGLKKSHVKAARSVRVQKTFCCLMFRSVSRISGNMTQMC